MPSRLGGSFGRMIRWVSSLIAVGLAITLAIPLVGCQSRTAPAKESANLRIPDQEARDFTLTETSEGKKNWTLWASYAAMYNDKNLVDARTIRIEFFDNDGKRYSTLTA